MKGTQSEKIVVDMGAKMEEKGFAASFWPEGWNERLKENLLKTRLARQNRRRKALEDQYPHDKVGRVRLEFSGRLTPPTAVPLCPLMIGKTGTRWVGMQRVTFPYTGATLQCDCPIARKAERFDEVCDISAALSLDHRGERKPQDECPVRGYIFGTEA